MKITLVNQTSFKISELKLQKILDSVFNQLSKKQIRQKKHLKKSEITCVFLNKSEMKILNNNFRKKNKPTDVLSFQPLDSNSMGELVFCLDVLTLQAKKQKHSLSFEFLYMLIHGILHLLGYDHELSKKEEKIMFSLQDLIFAKMTQETQSQLLTRAHKNLDCISLKK